MKTEFPAPDRIPGLRRLWKMSFGDSDEFLDRFFSLAFSPDRCCCITEGENVLAACYWFDCTCENQKFAYIYAVATDSAHRGKGLCRKLMADVRDLLAPQGHAGLILVPQDAGLRAMYARMGYRDATTVTEFTAPAEEPIQLRRLNAEEYAAVRRELLPPGSVVQEGVNLAFLASYALFFAGTGWAAAVTADGGKLICHELLGDADAAYGIAGALGCTEGRFRIPGPDTPFAQYLPLTADCPRPSWFGLAFD